MSSSPFDRREVLKAAAPNVLMNLQRMKRIVIFMESETPNSLLGRKNKSLLPFVFL